jgi:hypothetical protein
VNRQWQAVLVKLESRVVISYETLIWKFSQRSEQGQDAA